MPTDDAHMWTEQIQAFAAIAGVLVALLGFGLLFHQIRQLRQTIQAESHGRIYQHALEVQKLFVEHPDLRRFFYGREELKAGDRDYDKVLAFAELVADYLEHIMLQRPNVPSEVQKAWENYTGLMLTSSPVLRQVLIEHQGGYCRSFVQFCEKYCRNEDAV